MECLDLDRTAKIGKNLRIGYGDMSKLCLGLVKCQLKHSLKKVYIQADYMRSRKERIQQLFTNNGMEVEVAFGENAFRNLSYY